jgi:hypothetical protein
MKFTIEIPDQGECIIYDKENQVLEPKKEISTQSLQAVRRAGTLNMAYFKTNSGWVVIGGRTYWIP